MAYIDLTKITDIHAQNIIAGDPDLAALALENAEVDTRVAARDEQVKAADIPFDGSGYLQSEMLYLYCKYSFLTHLFMSVNGSYEADDIYAVKVNRYSHEMQLLKDRLNYSVITEEEVTEPSKRGSDIEIL